MTVSVTSTERLQRLLALVPYVVSRKSVGLAETAAAFGVTDRELVDDLNLLWCVELRAPDPYCPIDLSYEGGEIVVSQAESMDRPLRLAVDEASALLVALRMLAEIGEDPSREGLRQTPERFEKALRYLTSGYRQDPEKVLNGAMFSVGYDEMVVVKDIEVYSLCEHHLLPFFGKCHVAYIPNKKVVGLSKIARLVNMYARRLQVQERLTNQIATTIQERLSPLGVGVIIEARHLCMVMRGVEKQNSAAVTSAMLGAFRENKQTRDEFLSLIRGGKQ